MRKRKLKTSLKGKTQKISAVRDSVTWYLDCPPHLSSSEPKIRKDVEDGEFLHKPGTPLSEIGLGRWMIPRQIQYPDIVTRISEVLFGNMLMQHSTSKLYHGTAGESTPWP